jgi:dipeptidyl aminopeptidase/acylaminoacyl peptidase
VQIASSARWSRWASVLGLCLVMWATTGPSRAASALQSAHDFFRNAAIGSPQLSPDGRHLALIAYSSKGDERRTLAVAPVDNPRKLTVVAHFDDADVAGFEWVNNQRLVFGLVDLQEPMGDQKFSGLYAVNMDSSEFVWLVARDHGEQDDPNVARRPLRANHVLYTTLNDGSGDVILERYNLRHRENELRSTMLVRLNTKTKAQRDLLVFDVPDGVTGWVLDANDPPQPRAVVATDKGMARVLVREPGSKQWTQIGEANIYLGSPGAFSPLAFDADGQLYVSAGQDNPQSTSALYRYDMTARRIEDKPLLSLKGYDLEGGLVIDRDSRRLIGVHYVSDAKGTVWFDPGMKAVQEAVDKLMPATVNMIDCNRCVKAEKLVVTAYSDRLSPVYMLFDRASGKLQLIGASRPWIDDKQMAEQDAVRIKARDGLEIPLLVTRPKGKGPWPAVVLVHGGPNVRGSDWGWDPHAQFLASRGYLVVEPEFRGSKGFGFAHFKAGWKQWGLAMQDDVTDATKWAIAQGLADPKRIAIAGASYGGYAAMMGLVKEPDLYRAGINWVGVTDIDLLYDIGWSDTSGSDGEKYGMPTLIGDQKLDAAQLAATSPLQRAKEITKPVLMAYGDQDFRVPLPHGKNMRDALKKAGKVEVEWVVYEDEGHGWMLVKNKVDFWTRVEKFLARHMQ